jgi:hypothetical protein
MSQESEEGHKEHWRTGRKHLHKTNDFIFTLMQWEALRSFFESSDMIRFAF